MRTIAALAAACAAALAACGSKRVTPAAGDARADDLAGWRADLATIATEVPKRHPEPFHATPEPTFRAAVAELDRALPGLTDDQRLVGLARIVALFADAHTQLDLGPYARVLTYPLTVYWFSDGLFVVDAPEANRWAIGARVVTLGGKPIDDAIAALSSTVGYQADGWRRAQVADRLSLPQLVRGTGFAPADGPAVFGLVDPGDPTGATRELTAEPQPWRSAARTGPLPLYRQNPRSLYWQRYLEPERTLYVQYNACAQARDLSFADFTRQVEDVLDHQPVLRLVVDLRENQGGNSAIMQPLLDAIAARPALHGHVFALIGRHTFSSGLMNAIALAQQGAITVGEPAGSPANHDGEVQRLELPARGLAVYHATRRFAYDGLTGPAFAPDVDVELSSADYFAGKDPVLDAALARPRPDR
ncbi:MAG TPA: hypothetical protein VHE35_15300 [Kofleriaceae bacterium]|nr:hypothetical protein [Kofleriaceae bacterium]